MRLRSVAVLVIAFVPFATAPTVASGQPAASCVVEQVVDGDTLVCAGGERVRLLLIATPEMEREPFGTLAKTMLEALAPAGTNLELRLDVQERDRYGRLLAYAYLPDGRMANRELVRRGFAQPMTIPPNVRHVDLIRAAADSARRESAGLWALGAYAAAEGEAPRPAPAGADAPGRGNCHPSYPDVCIPPPPPDLNCGDIQHRRFRVVGSDPHRFDGDRDGVGCESG